MCGSYPSLGCVSYYITGKQGSPSNVPYAYHSDQCQKPLTWEHAFILGFSKDGVLVAVGHPRGRSSQGFLEFAVWPLVGCLLLLLVCVVQQVIHLS